MSTRRQRSRQRPVPVTRAATVKAFTLDPANVLEDLLWPPVADCGQRHHGACCWEPTCCRG